MKFFDNENKNLTWYNRNYFYLGTIIFILLNIVLFASLKSNWNNAFDSSVVNWKDPFNFQLLLKAILSSFEHADWGHVLTNMGCFLVCGIYIERKTGTLNFILLILSLLVFESSMCACVVMNLNWHGFSGVIFACYAFIFVNYCFSFSSKQNKFDIIFGALTCLVIYILMSGIITDSGLKFYGYPWNLIYNASHYSGFLAGLIIGLIIQITKLSTKKSSIKTD